VSDLNFDQRADLMFGTRTPPGATPLRVRAAAQPPAKDAAETLFGTSPPTAKNDDAPKTDEDRAATLYKESPIHNDALRVLEASALEDLATPEEARAAAASWTPLFDRHGLSATQSAQLAEVAVSVHRSPPDEATIARWQSESRDVLAAEYGPAGAAQALADARLVVDSDPALTKYLNDSGLGNHPRVVAAVAARARELRKAGKLPR